MSVAVSPAATQQQVTSAPAALAPPTLPPPNNLTNHFMPRPPPLHSKPHVGGGVSGTVSSATLPQLAVGVGVIPATSHVTLAKPPPASATRLPSSQRKMSLSQAVPISSFGVSSDGVACVALPPSPSSARSSALLSATPTGPAFGTPLTPAYMHSPSPLGAAYDEVRIPMAVPADPPHLVASPAHSTSLLHPQATPAAVTHAAHDTPPLALPSAHQIVPLPASFHAPPALINLPNIVIPPTPTLPAAVLWPHLTETQHTPPSPSAASTAVAQPALNEPALVAVSAASSSASSPAPLTSSMDSRQWAQLLLRYRAGDTPTASSRTTTSTSAASLASAAPAVAAATGAVAGAAGVASGPLHSPNTLTSGAAARPPSRARSRQGHIQVSRPMSHSHTSDDGGAVVDPEKQAMQNELHRLRAVIAMHTHAAAAASMTPPPPASALASPAIIPFASTPSPMHMGMVHTVPAPSSAGSAGPGLSWNTAFAALSTTFMQGHGSPAMQPYVGNTAATAAVAADVSFSALPAPAVVDGHSLPAAAAAPLDYRSTFRNMSMLIRSGSAAHTTAVPTPLSALAVPVSPSPHLPHPPAAGVLQRTRSEEPLSPRPPLPPSAHSFNFEARATSPPKPTTTVAPTATQMTHVHIHAAHEDANGLDEIEEDLAPHPLDSDADPFDSDEPVTPRLTRALLAATGSGASGDEGGVEFAADTHEIEEESHLRHASPHSSPPLKGAARDDDASPPDTIDSSARANNDLSPDAESAPEYPTHGAPPAATAPRLPPRIITSPSTASVPLFIPASGALNRKSPRGGGGGGGGVSVCFDPVCADRIRRDRADLHRAHAEELSSLRQKQAAQVKALEARFRRDLTAKDQRITQLERTQAKLLQPHAKIVAQNEELQALVQRLRDQITSLGASPVGGPGTNNKDEVRLSSPSLSHSTATDSDTFASLVLPAAAPDVSRVVSADSGAQHHSFAGAPDSAAAAAVEPFFNNSAPRTVTSRQARRRSQSFGGGPAAARFQQKLQHLQPVGSGAESPSISATNSPRILSAAGRSGSPSLRPFAAHAPIAKGGTGGGGGPRKNSLKSTTIPNSATSLAAAAAAAAAAASHLDATAGSLVGTPAPVTTRPQRQQGRGRANTVGGTATTVQT